MNKESIKILNILLPEIPIIDIDNLFGSFSISDMTEGKGITHEYDRLIANFLVKGGFAIVLVPDRFMSEFEESRTLELTDKGIKLHKSGSYQEYIGLPLLIILKIFRTDLYYWWVNLSDKKKGHIKEVTLGLFFAVLFGLLWEVGKHYFSN